MNNQKKKRFYRLSYQKHDPNLVCNTNTLNCELCTLIISRWFTIKVLLTIINILMHWKYREWRGKIELFRSNHDRDPLITNAVSYHRQIYIQAVSAKSVNVPLCISSPSHARGQSCPCLQGYGESAQKDHYLPSFFCVLSAFIFIEIKSPIGWTSH